MPSATPPSCEKSERYTVARSTVQYVYLRCKMATSSTNKEERQVLGFKTVKGLERYVQKLQLRRIMIADLDMSSDIEGGYIGGRVVATHASSYSQGHTLSIFVRDESVSDTQDESCQLLIEIDGNIAEDMPSLLSEEFMLFVSHGLIMLNEVEFSQDHDCCLQVKGPQPRVWIVHKNAEKPGFFQQQSCKAAWFQKQKKKRLELEEAETKEYVCTNLLLHYSTYTNVCSGLIIIMCIK